MPSDTNSPETKSTTGSSTTAPPSTDERSASDEQTPPGDSSETPSSETTETDNPSREAAKWRTRLRETEAELAGAREALEANAKALEAARAALLATHCESAGLKPDALTAAHEVSEFFGDDGAFNSESFEAAVTDTRERFGIPMKPSFTVPSQGTVTVPVGREDSWFDAIRYRERTPRSEQADRVVVRERKPQ